MSEQLPEGLSVIEVVPGSPDDPFTARTPDVSQQAQASPAGAPAFGTTNPTPPEGQQVQPGNATPPTIATPPASPPASAQPTPEAETPLQVALREGKLEEYIAGAVAKAAEPQIRHYQSVADKRINELEQKLKQAQAAETQRQREAKLANEDLTDEEKALLREKWSLEDEKAQLAADIEEGDRYFRSMYVAGLVQEAQQFGVTAEQLEQFDEPEEMDAYVAKAELAWYKAGNRPTQVVPNNAVQANPTGSAPAANSPAVTQPAPAGASAPSDVGGGAPAAPAAKPEEGFGIDVMARNLNKSEWVSVPLPA